MILSLFFLSRHMKEISELQAFQRNEIECLYKELGKTLPPNVGLLHAAPPSGRRRRASKHKLKAGKLLNPMVQQLKNNVNSSTERKGVWQAVVGMWFVWYVLIGEYFFQCEVHKLKTGILPGSEIHRNVWFHDSLWLTQYSFLPLPKVKVLPVHPAPQLKAQFCQTVLPTPVAAQAIKLAPPESRSTPSNPVRWRALSPQTTSTPDDTVMEWPTKLALAKVHIMSSWTCCGCACVCMCMLS